MDIKSALDILRPKSPDLEAIKAAYRELIKEYHPDRNPNGLEFTKTINLAYETLKVAIEKGYLGNFKAQTGDSVILKEMEEAIKKLQKCKGLEIEICGTWLWIGGNTKYWSKFLKEQVGSNGKRLFSYAPNKKMWYWKPEWYHKRGKKQWDMNEIRVSFGSKKFEMNDDEQIYI
jgi:curved DNA-binding protein CbpA